MDSYLGWVAITALVVAVAALAVGLAETHKRRRNERAARELYEATQGYRVAPGNPSQEKWEQEIKRYEDQFRAK